VLPAPRFQIGCLVALEDRQGFALALGIVLELDISARKVTLLTPLERLDAVDSIRIGNLLVDPETFSDQLLL
jgi:polynucleotide 5'-kinase involved in rRNA processing